jgi:hypothetical protein
LDWSIVAFQGWERGCIGGESWSFQDRDGILEVRQKQFHFFLLLTHFLFLLSVSVAFRSQTEHFSELHWDGMSICTGVVGKIQNTKSIPLPTFSILLFQP